MDLIWDNASYHVSLMVQELYQYTEKLDDHNPLPKKAHTLIQMKEK